MKSFAGMASARRVRSTQTAMCPPPLHYVLWRTALSTPSACESPYASEHDGSAPLLSRSQRWPYACASRSGQAIDGESGGEGGIRTPGTGFASTTV